MILKSCWINRSICLVGVVSMTFTLQSVAAEFSGADVIPEVTSLVLTQTSVALTVDPTPRKRFSEERAETRYFVANRADLKFQQITEQAFSDILKNDHYHDRLADYQFHGFNVVSSEPCVEYGFEDSVVQKTFEFGSSTISVDMLCRSFVGDALLFNDELWISTYEEGNHGVYGAEGIVVTSLRGDIKTRIDIGGSQPTGIVRDPWSTDVWVSTRSQLTVIADNHTVKNRFWPIHDFDKDLERPDVFVAASMEQVRTNPFAILAYVLGEKHYQRFFHAVEGDVAVGEKDVLYRFFMWGDRYYHSPQLPQELDVLLDFAEPTKVWRRFACMTPGERAEELCGLELEMWPAPLR